MAEDKLLFFPLRHYSPAGARFVEEVLDERPFDAVLIEGPSDFNDRFGELFFDHQLPLALYSYAIAEDGRRLGAFYPFCEFSPEWRALKIAGDKKIPTRFIDMPWHQLAGFSARKHRYSDANFRGNPYILALCKKLGLQGFDELWDVLFELDPIEDWRAYVERCRSLCDKMRELDEWDDRENELRERFMAAEIRKAQRDFGPRLLIVTGAYHSSGLEALLATDLPGDKSKELPEPQEDLDELDEVPQIVRHGIALTPFTYPRIDRLSGYPAGLQGPALYEALWDARRQDLPFDAGKMLAAIIAELRRRDQIASTADVMAVETTARALALIRGRREIWRFDLLDALSSSLIKEAQDAEYDHPFLMVARQIMTGDRRGSIDARAGLPPLVHDVKKSLDELGLSPEDEPRQVHLAIEDDADLQKSRVLHRCAYLNLTGIDQIGGAELFERSDTTRIWEKWHLQWHPEFEAALIECSAYGTTLEEAASSRLLEWKDHFDSASAGAAGRVLVEAILMGLQTLQSRFVDDLEASIDRDADFFSIAACLGHLIFIYRFDDVFRAGEIEGLRLAGDHLLERAFARGLWLYENLGRLDEANSIKIIAAIGNLHGVLRIADQDTRSRRSRQLAGSSKRVAGDESQSPIIRGAASGICLRLGSLKKSYFDRIWDDFFEPIDVGDYLTGLFYIAREAFLRDRPFLVAFDGFVDDLDEDEFLEALPALRMAFTFFTPREKLEICDLLFADYDSPSAKADEKAPITEADLGQAASFDARLREVAAFYGIELPRQTAETLSSPSLPQQRPVPLKLTETKRIRWRLLLGDGSQSALGELSDCHAAQDEHLAFLYDREYGEEQNIRKRDGNLCPSSLTVPEWINGVHELFPKQTIERLEKDALERYALDEIVTRPDILERLKPNLTLLKAVLRCKPLMNQHVLAAARHLVRKVIEELMEKWARDIENPFLGAPNRRRRSPIAMARNFDARETIRRNLRYFDRESGRLIIRKPYFFSRRRRHVDRWQIIVVVDQSGSMLDSVIHSAITASILAGVQTIRSHLIAFDTGVVDLTSDCRDPVETLMSVQLGGGTDIGNALRYAHSLVDNPRRAMIVVITDFFEGANPAQLFSTTREIVESGITLLGLAALDHDANPFYDRDVARKMVELGAEVGAMTPGELANWIAERVQ